MRGARRALVRKGVTFRNNFATYPLCCPSRVTFLTGQYAHNHHVTANEPPHGGYPEFVREVPPRRLLPVRLQRAHYRTAYAGTYINYYGLSSSTEIPHGWDRWYGLTSGTDGRVYGYTLNTNGRLRHYGSGPSDYQTDVLARKAARFVRRSSNRAGPFFLTFAPFTPHTESDAVVGPDAHRNPRPAPRDIGHFAGKPLPRPPSFNEADIRDKPYFKRQHSLGGDEIRDLHTLYQSRLESLLSVDDAVTRLVHTLKRVNELDHTVIILTSDNGYLLGEHRLTGKELPYEESVGIPLVIRGPGFPRGVRRGQLTGNIDLAPTIRDLAGLGWRRGTDGIPLKPLARHPRKRRNRDILFERSKHEGRTYKGVRTRNYVFVRYQGGASELYDLRRDPHQLDNRVRDRDYRRIRRQLARRLRAIGDCSGNACR
jgi:N-acetylglucosamine-6-sulfatase